MIDKYVQYLKANEVKGVYVHGTTGEGFSLTNVEKLTLAKAYKEAIANHYPEMLFIVTISSTSMKETQALAKDLEVLGVDALALLPSLYYKVSTPQELVTYVKLVADAAPKTPLLYYYIPSFVTENGKQEQGIFQLPVPALQFWELIRSHQFEIIKLVLTRSNLSFYYV